MAECVGALGEEHAALWARARDLDSLRFRADGRINRIIREVAANPRATDVMLVDIEEAISRRPRAAHQATTCSSTTCISTSAPT